MNDLIMYPMSGGENHISYVLNHDYYDWAEVQFDEGKFNGVIVLYKDKGGPVTDDERAVINVGNPMYEILRDNAIEDYNSEE